MERFHSEKYDTTDDEKEEVSENETEDDFHNEKVVEEEEEEDIDEEVEEEEEEINEEADDAENCSDSEEGSGDTGNQSRTIKLESALTPFQLGYNAFSEYTKIDPSTDCFLSGGKTRGGFIRKSVDELLLELSTRFKSCELLQASDFEKVFDNSKKKPPQRTQIIRNLLDESLYCTEIQTTDPSYMEAKDLVSKAGPLSKDTIRRHVILLKKQTKTGGDSGTMMCIFNNDKPPPEYNVKRDISRKKTFITIYTEDNLLATSTKKHFHFHDFFKNLLRLQVLFNIFSFLIFCFFCPYIFFF